MGDYDRGEAAVMRNIPFFSELILRPCLSRRGLYFCVSDDDMLLRQQKNIPIAKVQGMNKRSAYWALLRCLG